MDGIITAKYMSYNYMIVWILLFTETNYKKLNVSLPSFASNALFSM